MRSSGDGMPARFEQRDRLLARLRLGEAAVAHQHLDDLLADGVARIERGHRLLEDHREAVAAQVAQLAVRQIEQPDAVEGHRAGHFGGRLRQQAHHGQRGHALAAAGLADEPERRAAREREIDAVDRDRAAARDRRGTRRADFRSPAAARPSLRLGASAAAMPRIELRAVDDRRRDRACSARTSRSAPSARGSPLRAARARRADRCGRRRAGRDRAIPPRRRSAAPPTACRACRRPRPRRPSARRSDGAETAARRSPHRPSRSPAITAGPASMLPATEKPSPAVEPHQSMQSLPVCAAMRPAASIT